jgi:hypothetical protein
MCKHVKLSLYRPGHALRFQEVEASRVSRQSAHEGGAFTHDRLYLSRRYSWYSFLIEAESTPFQ